MKHTPLDDPSALRDACPATMRALIEGTPIHDSSSSPQARVYYADAAGGLYLKRAAAGALAREATMTGYFHGLGIGARLLGYVGAEEDWMLTAALGGDDCTAARYLERPERLAETIGTLLRRLHETDASDCPMRDCMDRCRADVEANVEARLRHPPEASQMFGHASVEEAYRVASEGLGGLTGRVLLHGDYCLPNIMLDDWRLSGYIDVGGAGVGDRHVDVFWGAWTLMFNLHTDRYRNRFLDAYGRDVIDEEALAVVGAAAVFG